MGWLVIVFFLYLGLMCFIGWRKGFSRMLISLLSIAVSILITWAFAPKIKGLLVEYTTIDESVAHKIGETVLGDAETDEEVDLAIQNAPIPGSMKASAEAHLSVREEGVTKKEALTEMLADILLTILVDVILFIVSMILISLLGKLLDLVNKIPGFKQVNGALGALLGLLKAIIYLDLFFLVLMLFSGTAAGLYIQTEIQKSGILNWFYENNLLMYIFDAARQKLLG